VGRPKNFDLEINLSAVNEIGVMIPPNVLARANRVIKLWQNHKRRGQNWTKFSNETNLKESMLLRRCGRRRPKP
jgi:hypothetical protein